MVAELFEYPFDLAKVRLQAQLLVPSTSSNNAALRFNGPLHCLIQTWKEEGFRGLYRVCRCLPSDITQLTFCRDYLYQSWAPWWKLHRSLSRTPSSKIRYDPCPRPLMNVRRQLHYRYHNSALPQQQQDS